MKYGWIPQTTQPKVHMSSVVKLPVFVMDLACQHALIFQDLVWVKGCRVVSLFFRTIHRYSGDNSDAFIDVWAMLGLSERTQNSKARCFAWIAPVWSWKAQPLRQLDPISPGSIYSSQQLPVRWVRALPCSPRGAYIVNCGVCVAGAGCLEKTANPW